MEIQHLTGFCQKQPHVEEDPEDSAGTGTQLEWRHKELRHHPLKLKFFQEKFRREKKLQPNEAVNARLFLI